MTLDALLPIGIFVFIILTMNGTFLGIIFFMNRKVAAVREWPSTSGTILSSELERRQSSNKSGSVLYPVVEYSYRVAGKSYTSRTIAPGMEVGGSGAPGVVARYPAGSQVSVYYDPQNPSDAVLEKKNSAMIWMWLILAVLDFMILGLGVAILFFGA